MTHKTQPTAHAEITAPISADLRGIDDAGAQPDQDDFIQWLSGTYPDAYSADEARRLWRHEHVSALAWEAAKARYAAQPARECMQQSAEPEAFLEAPDVQDESGINTHYSRRLVIDCIAAALQAAPQLTPVEPGALHASIRELDAWESRADGNELTPSESDSVVLVLHELKRLQAAPPAPAGVAVPDGWMENLGFELDAPADGVWMVIDDTGARREAGLVERVLWKELVAIRAALAAAPAQAVAVPVAEWDGKLPERLQRALNALRLECSPAIVADVEYEVRSHYEAMHTSLATVRRMFGAARDRLEALDAAQPDPFAPAQEHATQLAGQGRDLEVTDEMALAFHRAISDGAIGQDDVDEIKDGLRAAFCNIAAPAQAQGCTRSHPHENMSPMCVLRTEIARLKHAAAIAQATAVPVQAQEDARDAARYRLVRRGQHWSVIDGIGDELRGDKLDAAADRRLAAQQAGDA